VFFGDLEILLADAVGAQRIAFLLEVHIVIDNIFRDTYMIEDLVFWL
jgi:hypothetical protein